MHSDKILSSLGVWGKFLSQAYTKFCNKNKNSSRMPNKEEANKGVCIHIHVSYNTELIHIPRGQLTTTIMQ